MITAQTAAETKDAETANGTTIPWITGIHRNDLL